MEKLFHTTLLGLILTNGTDHAEVVAVWLDNLGVNALTRTIKTGEFHEIVLTDNKWHSLKSV
jgi:hypothetical protein